PLTNGQLVVGSSGGAPQAQTLTPSAGITITNRPGGITIAATPGSASGLYRQVISATPTSTSTGLSNWLNQAGSVVTDSPIGPILNAPSVGNTANMSARFVAGPSPPYTITVLVGVTRNTNNFGGFGIGWYDNSSKLHVLSYVSNNGGSAYLEVEK